MKREPVEEITDAPEGTAPGIARGGSLMRRLVHVLYIVFNGACLAVYGYQVYLRIIRGAWTKIPSGVLLARRSGGRFSILPGAMGKTVDWMLNVELAYTLCAIAMLFYGARWWIDRSNEKIMD